MFFGKTKLTLNKALLIGVALSTFLCFSCTYTPWHREQAEVFLNKGISYLTVGQYNSALKELMESAKYYSGNPKVHYYLGMAYHGKGMQDKAIEAFEEAVSLDKNYSEAHNYLGILYSEKERWDDAIEEFEKALSNYLYDTPSMALYNMASAYYAKHDYKKALLKYNEALRVDPMTGLRPQIYKKMGQIYYDQDNFPEAIWHFKKSLEMDASLYDAYFLLGQSYLKNRDNENARRAFQQVIRLSPESSFGRRAKNYLQSLK
jgi:type IV pilus assembly protein PilF